MKFLRRLTVRNLGESLSLQVHSLSPLLFAFSLLVVLPADSHAVGLYTKAFRRVLIELLTLVQSKGYT